MRPPTTAQGNAGELLADWRRINVALTRAKAKMIIVGCGATLAGAPMLRRMVELVKAQGWQVPLAGVLQ